MFVAKLSAFYEDPKVIFLKVWLSPCPIRGPQAPLEVVVSSQKTFFKYLKAQEELFGSNGGCFCVFICVDPRTWELLDGPPALRTTSRSWSKNALKPTCERLMRF